MAPALEDGVAKALGSLQAAGLVFPVTMKPENATNVYSFALAKLSESALKLVTMKIIRGEFPNLNMHFIPTPPELANAVRLEQQKISEDLTRARLKAEAMGGHQSETVSPESRARMLELLRLWREGKAPEYRGTWEPAAMVAARKKYRDHEIIAKDVKMEEFKAMAKSKALPVGATYVAIISTIFAPVSA
jgi:hypothetical protein